MTVRRFGPGERIVEDQFPITKYEEDLKRGRVTTKQILDALGGLGVMVENDRDILDGGILYTLSVEVPGSRAGEVRSSSFKITDEEAEVLSKRRLEVKVAYRLFWIGTLVYLDARARRGKETVRKMSDGTELVEVEL